MQFKRKYVCNCNWRISFITAGFKPTVRANTDVDTDPEYVKSLSDGLVKACYGTYQSHAIRYRRIKLQSDSEVSIYSKAPISLSQIKSPGVTV